MNNMMMFAKFYVTAIINGTPLDMMLQRYPDYDFELTENAFVLRKKEDQPAPQLPAVTPAGKAAAQPVNLTIPASSEIDAAKAEAARAVEAAAGTPAPLMDVQ